MQLAKKADDITSQLIYSKIEDYDIYRFYLGDFKIGQAFCNTIRGDRNPSMVIYVGEAGHLFHRDYADERFKGGAFDLVTQLFPGMNYDAALKRVASDFGITDAASEEYKRIVSQYNKPLIDKKRHSLIQVNARKWEKADLDYWAEYGITLENLREEEVYCVKQWSLNRRRMHIGPGELCFAYRYNEGFKVYYPTRTKDEGKWTTNITTAHVENLSALKSASKVLITKAKKDRMVLQRYFPTVLSVQNESRACFTPEFISALQGKEVWINFDSDEAGVKNCKILTEEFGFKYINIPKKYMPIKDFADLYRMHGEGPIVDYLIQKGLL